MLATLQDALIDSLKLFPFLFVIYLIIEFIEFRFGDSFKHRLMRLGRLGPIFGALVGIIPQCGFSVVATSLFISGYCSIGTLISVYIATSDEALPILISHPDKWGIVLPLIIIKLIYAIIIGFLIDTFLPIIKAKTKKPVAEIACCGQHKSFSFHPLVHSLKLIFYLFIFNFIFGLIFIYYQPQNLISPFISALIGLIPNCAASVAITQMYLKNIISFGTLFAGLSSSAGLGILVLIKENKNLRQSLGILLILYSFSVLGGFMLQNIL